MRFRRLVRAVPAGLLAVALLAACGDETSPDAEGSDPAAESGAPRLTSRTLAGTALDLPKANSALLAQANMPVGFDSLGPQTPDEPETSGAEESEDAEGTEGTEESTGCETEESFEDRFDRGGLATTRTDTGYIYGDEARLLIITSLVTSFADDEQSQSAFEAVEADFESCTHYEETDEATGDTTVIDVESDTEPATDDVDSQLNLLGEGSWSGVAFDALDLGFGLSLARVDNNVTLTQVMSLGVSADNELLAPYTEIAVDRLVAVMAGETPQDVAGPAPTPVPGSRLPVPPSADTLGFERFFAIDPRFSLPD